MKAPRISFLLFMLAAYALLPQRAAAQAAEIQQLLLNVEKLSQLRQILSDMKRGYDILHQGYDAVRSVSEGSFHLHEAFLDGLLAVNPSLHRYRRVADILTAQQRMVREYSSAYRLFRQQGSFSPAELDYLGTVYAHLLEQSVKRLDELALVLTGGTLRMSDDERLEAIDRIFADTEDKLTFLRHFNRQAAQLALQRANEQHDVSTMQQLYQVTH